MSPPITASKSLPVAHRKIIVSISEQTARLMEGGKEIKAYPVSTSKFGIGTEPGSNKTPLGRFAIHEKVGDQASYGTVFKDRVPNGEVCTENPRHALWQSDQDFITTRILWLKGLDPENANTLERFIYFHGTNQEQRIGSPASHGCVRMTNHDIIDLFARVDEETEVVILA